ncbi:hypothetical protein L1987_28224 [Smallanthus sonchifolius]|uniref:Uncharacterized protein n=1 Tax=Smallanthus sonchifolius TaxID=185202 RepID=A0ACB9ICZ5_9ASTR|nr:hypothetical protein L1987_28224 [Smallanthus sonchifolius]
MATEIKREMTPQEEIWNYILGYTHIALVKCAIELNIPDILENRESPITLADLTSEIGCSRSSLHRVMSPAMMAPWNKLSTWVLNNKELPFVAAHSMDLWDFGVANPEHSKLFNDGMACDARATVSAVLEGCPQVFEGLGTVVDVGGGNWTALRLIVEACPWIKGTNFDLPHVLAAAGVEHVGGSMFDHVPKADAVYMMKCREAIPQDKGKVIIVDVVLGREEDHEFKGVGLMFDITMMMCTNKGKERNLEEWAYVFHKAGFTRYDIKHIEAPLSVIEVYP